MATASTLARSAALALAALAGAPLGAGPGRDQDRRDLRLHRPVRGRRLRGRGDRHPDRDRHGQRAGRRRGPQDHAGRGRCPVQGRGRDRRGRAPAQPGERRSDHGRLFERPLRAARPEGRRPEGVHVGERLRRVRGVQGQEPAVRVPAAGPQRPVRLGVLHLPQGEQRGEARHRARGPQGRDHPRGRALRLRRRRGQRGELREYGMEIVLEEGYARPRPTCRAWSPSCAARSPT